MLGPLHYRQEYNETNETIFNRIQRLHYTYLTQCNILQIASVVFTVLPQILKILAEYGHSDRNGKGEILRKKRKNSTKIGMVDSYANVHFSRFVEVSALAVFTCDRCSPKITTLCSSPFFSRTDLKSVSWKQCTLYLIQN